VLISSNTYKDLKVGLDSCLPKGASAKAKTWQGAQGRCYCFRVAPTICGCYWLLLVVSILSKMSLIGGAATADGTNVKVGNMETSVVNCTQTVTQELVTQPSQSGELWKDSRKLDYASGLVDKTPRQRRQF